MIVGDIKNTYASQVELHGVPDYLFLDSYHSHGFGMWYVQPTTPPPSSPSPMSKCSCASLPLQQKLGLLPFQVQVLSAVGKPVIQATTQGRDAAMLSIR